MSKELTPLDEWNNIARKNYFNEYNPRPNGIACPKCGKELVDVEPNTMLTSWPPQLRIACQHCRYTGYRIV